MHPGSPRTQIHALLKTIYLGYLCNATTERYLFHFPPDFGTEFQLKTMLPPPSPNQRNKNSLFIQVRDFIWLPTWLHHYNQRNGKETEGLWWHGAHPLGNSGIFSCFMQIMKRHSMDTLTSLARGCKNCNNLPHFSKSVKVEKNN